MLHLFDKDHNRVNVCLLIFIIMLMAVWFVIKKENSERGLNITRLFNFFPSKGQPVSKGEPGELP